MSQHTELDEARFARRVAHALDAGAAALPPATRARLAAARARALARKKPEMVAVRVPLRALAGAGAPLGLPASRPTRGARRLLPLLAAIVAAAAMFGMGHAEREKRIDDLAVLDAQLLSDSLPIDAYLDHGFDAYLKGER